MLLGVSFGHRVDVQLMLVYWGEKEHINSHAQGNQSSSFNICALRDVTRQRMLKYGEGKVENRTLSLKSCCRQKPVRGN